MQYFNVFSVGCGVIADLLKLALLNINLWNLPGPEHQFTKGKRKNFDKSQLHIFHILGVIRINVSDCSTISQSKQQVCQV